MKVIGRKRCWREPAVFIGLLVTLALLAGALLTGTRLERGRRSSP